MIVSLPGLFSYLYCIFRVDLGSVISIFTVLGLNLVLWLPFELGDNFLSKFCSLVVF